MFASTRAAAAPVARREDPPEEVVERAERAGGHGDARGDRARVMTREKLADLRLHDFVAAAAVGEDAELVVHFLGAVDAYGDADAIVGQEIDDLRSEQRGVGSQAEVDLHAFARGLFGGIVDDVAKQREIHQRFAAEEGDVDRFAAFGLREEIVDGSLRGLHVHELLFAFGRGDLVFAELVAVLAGEIALVGDVHHQVCSGKFSGSGSGFSVKVTAVSRIARTWESSLTQPRTSSGAAAVFCETRPIS